MCENEVRSQNPYTQNTQQAAFMFGSTKQRQNDSNVTGNDEESEDERERESVRFMQANSSLGSEVHSGLFG